MSPQSSINVCSPGLFYTVSFYIFICLLEKKTPSIITLIIIIPRRLCQQHSDNILGSPTLCVLLDKMSWHKYPNWVRKYLYSVSSVRVSVSVPHSAAPRLAHRPAWIRYRSSCARHLRVLSLWSALGLGHGPSARAGPCNMSWVLTSERTLCNGAEPQHCALRCYSVEVSCRGRGEKWGRRREKNGSCYAFL